MDSESPANRSFHAWLRQIYWISNIFCVSNILISNIFKFPWDFPFVDLYVTNGACTARKILVVLMQELVRARERMDRSVRILLQIEVALCVVTCLGRPSQCRALDYSYVATYPGIHSSYL